MRKPRRLTLEALEARDVPATLAAQLLAGGAGDQVATGISVIDPGTGYQAYVSGRTTASGEDGVALRFNTPYSLAPGSLMWNTQWPMQANGDTLNSVVATPAGTFLGGSSYARTTDTVGDKEAKGVVVGMTAGGSANWVRQAPNAPGAFTYGGYERINDLTAAVEGGTTVLYATGSSQSNGANGGRLFLTKVTANGTVQWTRTDTAITANSDGYDVIASNGFVYVAGLTYDDGTRRGTVRKYTTSGSLVWSRASGPGMFTSVTADATGNLYLGGNTNGTNTNFLLEKWNANGTVQWSRTFDRNAAADAVNGLALLGGQLFAVGETRGGTAGGSDGIILTVDPATGNLVRQDLWGGSGDDSFQDVSVAGIALHVAGTTRSFGSNGADIAYTTWSLNQGPTNVTLTPASVLENRPAGTYVGTLVTTDPDITDGHTYSLVSGAGSTDNAQFTLLGSLVHTAAAFDYEAKSSYSVRVRATDAGGLWVERALTVTVVDVNESPTFDLTHPTLIVPNNTVPQAVLNWAHNMANPEAGQSTWFEVVSNSNPSLFATLPTIAPDGTLTYAPAATKTGTATIGVVRRDNGGTANGGSDASAVKTFVVEVVGSNLALNTARSGLPSPLASDSGWGGGSDTWEVADGRRSYPEWYHGLAFTGGSGGWVEPAGVRQLTVDLAARSTISEVFVWHHGADHTPAAATLEYFDGTTWRPITFTRQFDASFEQGSGSGLATADRYTFTPVTGTKVRYSFDNRLVSVTGSQITHGWVYEVEVIGAPAPLPTTIESTFDTDDDGWRVTDDAQNGTGIPDYHPTGGNPGGHLTATDYTRGPVWWWVAPAKFRGDVSATFGTYLTFDLKQAAQPLPDSHDDVILRSGSVALVADLPVNPGVEWTSYSVPLRAVGGWVHQGTGIPATDAEIAAVMANVTSLWIRGEYLAGGAIGGIDNVALGGDAPTVSVLDASVIEGDDGPTLALVPVRLSAISTGPVSFDFVTADGTAWDGKDYAGGTGTLVFAPGQTTVWVGVEVFGDTEIEADETFAVRLVGVTGATVDDDTGEVVIVNDDPSGGDGPPKRPAGFAPVEAWDGFGLGDDDGIFFPRVWL